MPCLIRTIMSPLLAFRVLDLRALLCWDYCILSGDFDSPWVRVLLVLTMCLWILHALLYLDIGVMVLHALT